MLLEVGDTYSLSPLGGLADQTGKVSAGKPPLQAPQALGVD